MEYIFGLIGIFTALALVRHYERRPGNDEYPRWQNDENELEDFVAECFKKESGEREIMKNVYADYPGISDYRIYTAKEQIENYFADDEYSKLKCLEILESGFSGGLNENL